MIEEKREEKKNRGSAELETKVRWQSVRQQRLYQRPPATRSEPLQPGKGAGNATRQCVGKGRERERETETESGLERGERVEVTEQLHIILSASATSHLYCNANPSSVPDGAFPASWAHGNMIIYPLTLLQSLTLLPLLSAFCIHPCILKPAF